MASSSEAPMHRRNSADGGGAAAPASTQREASFDGLRTVRPGSSGTGNLSHRMYMADRRMENSQLSYRQQAAQRRRELAVRARHTQFAEASYTAGTASSRARSRSNERAPQDSPADARASSRSASRERADQTHQAESKSPRRGPDDNPVGGLWRDRSQGRTVSPTRQRTPDYVTGRRVSSSEPDGRRSPGRQYGGGLAPPAERPPDFDPAATQQQASGRGGSAGATKRATPRTFSSRTSPRVGSKPQRSMPPVDVNAAAASRDGRPTGRQVSEGDHILSDRGGAQSSNARGGSKSHALEAGDASRRRRASPAPATINEATYHRLLDCGGYRAVLRASDVQHAPKPGDDLQERKSMLLKNLRSRIRGGLS